VLGEAGFPISEFEISEMFMEFGFKGAIGLSYILFVACGAG
jgi:hypothetical protein